MKVVTLAAAAEKLGWDFTLRDPAVRRPGRSSGGGPPRRPDRRRLRRSEHRRLGRRGDAAVRRLGRAAESRRHRPRSTDGSSATTTRSTTTASGLGWAWDDIAAELLGERERAAVQRGLRAADDSRRARPSARRPCVTVSPDYSGLTVSNLITTGAAGSTAGGRAAALPRHFAPRTARACCRCDAAVFADRVGGQPDAVLRDGAAPALIANGIDVHGAGRGHRRSRRPAGARRPTPLVTHQSPPLSMLATTMMKLSQNLYAETLLKTIGAGTAEPARRRRAALRCVRSVCRAGTSIPAALIQVDGSGLSRYNLHHAGSDGRHPHARRARRAPASGVRGDAARRRPQRHAREPDEGDARRKATPASRRDR